MKIEKPSDLIREPYVLDFLKIPEPYHLSESELETQIIDHLQNFHWNWAKVLLLLADNTASLLATDIITSI